LLNFYDILNAYGVTENAGLEFGGPIAGLENAAFSSPAFSLRAPMHTA